MPLAGSSPDGPPVIVDVHLRLPGFHREPRLSLAPPWLLVRSRRDHFLRSAAARIAHLGQDPQQGIDVDVPLERQVEGTVGADAVQPPAPFTRAGDVPRSVEDSDDPLRCPFGDVEQVGDVANADARVTRDEEQGDAVVGQEPEIGTIFTTPISFTTTS